MSQSNQVWNIEPGTILSGNFQYQIISEIGRGAMAVVYLAHQLDLDRNVAIRVLAAEETSDQSLVQRFINEGCTVASLSHPNMIQGYDAGVANGNVYYFAMEYVCGETLLRRLRREGHLDVRSALHYAREIATALDYGWRSQQLTHGDIKPENIMVTANNQAKLADFGLARGVGHDYAGQDQLLTPFYAPPELISRSTTPYGCLSDIYAFGASLFHLLAGQPPFTGKDGRAVMEQHLHTPPPALAELRMGIGADLSDFVAQMLEKDPEKRPSDWQEVLSGLEACIEAYGESKAQRGTSGGIPASSGGKLQIQSSNGILTGKLKVRTRKRLTRSATFYAVLAFLVLVILAVCFLRWQSREIRQQNPLPESPKIITDSGNFFQSDERSRNAL